VKKAYSRTKFRQSLFCTTQCFLVLVDADNDRILRRPEYRFGVPAEPERCIDKQPAATGIEQIERFIEQDRLVAIFGVRVLHIQRSEGRGKESEFNIVNHLE
jgi:hypothetical protein